MRPEKKVMAIIKDVQPCTFSLKIKKACSALVSLMMRKANTSSNANTEKNTPQKVINLMGKEEDEKKKSLASRHFFLKLQRDLVLLPVGRL